MSAIWGAISQDHEIDSERIAKIFKDAYKDCVIDKVQEYIDDKMVLGCGLQYFTRESLKEKLPICKVEEEVYFTADAMVDNRTELLRNLGWRGEVSTIPDGRILFEIYQKYGEHCLNNLVGAFTFAHYNRQKEELAIVTDPTGNRCIYYTVEEGVIYFSTLIEPLLQIRGKRDLNKRWLADFVAHDDLAIMTEYEETPYERIYKVQAGSVITWNHGVMKKRRYWNPQVRLLDLKSDEEYKAKVKEVYGEAVKCLLRSDVSTLLLSGGLDSTSVATIAAKELRKNKETLYTFTSVPERTYKSKLSEFYVTDETDPVIKTKEFLELIGCKLSCEFMEMPGINGWDARKEEAKALEIPYKSMQNMLWMLEGSKRAKKIGSRILLHGSYGNVTISADFANFYLRELYQTDRKEFLRECHMFAEKGNYSKRDERRVIRGFVKDFKKKPEPISVDGIFGKSFIKEEILTKYHGRERFLKQAEEVNTSGMSSLEYQEFMKNDLLFAMKGEFSTKQSLATGVIMRDPTMDKRLIELCMSLPVTQFVRNGVGRRLIREYYADEMPPHVMKPGYYGLQSADLVERVLKDKERIFSEIYQIFESHQDNDIVDCERAMAEVQRMGADTESIQLFDMLRIQYSALVLEFMDQKGQK